MRPGVPPNMARLALQQEQLRRAQMGQGPMTAQPPPSPFNTKCPNACPDICAPVCHDGCCTAAKRDYNKVQTVIQTHEMRPGDFGFPSSFKNPLQLKYSALANHPKAILPISRQNCPIQCFAACKPNCEVRCCMVAPMNRFSPYAADNGLHSRTLMQQMALAQLMQQRQQALNQQQERKQHVDTVDAPMPGGNYESNVETIHALSKDMITKPEPLNEVSAIDRQHIQDPSQFMLRGNIPTVAAMQALMLTGKRSQLPSAPVSSKSTVTKKSVVPDASKDAPKALERKSDTPTPELNPTEVVEKKSNIMLNQDSNLKPSNTSIAELIPKDESKKSDLPSPSVNTNENQNVPSTKSSIETPLSIDTGKDSNTPEKKEDNNKKTEIQSAEKTAKSTEDATKKSEATSTMMTTMDTTKCPHLCSDTCAPDCDKACCNRQIVYESFHKNEKRSKVKYQLEMLK